MGRDLGCKGDGEALPNQIFVAYSSYVGSMGAHIIMKKDNDIR
jgi:hypothetical protein